MTQSDHRIPGGSAPDGSVLVTAADVGQAIELAVSTLRELPPAAWDGKAGAREWDRWETVEHLCDAVFSYAVQLAPATPPRDGDVPSRCESRRPGGPDNAIYADRAAGPPDCCRCLRPAAGC